MATVAGGSGAGAGGGRRCSSGTPPVVPQKPKKPSAWEKACIRYLEAVHVECVARGEEPPFGGRYAPPTGTGGSSQTAVVGGANTPPTTKPPSSPSKDA